MSEKLTDKILKHETNDQKNSLDLSEEVLYRKKYFDALTGLKNLTFFKEELGRINLEENLPVSIMICDINKFKLVNDVLGSIIGDKVLKSFSTIFRRTCRPRDIIARIEKDKFAFILFKTDEVRTAKLIENIKDQIKYNSYNTLQISVTFGFKTKHTQVGTIWDTLEEAEKQLEESKKTEKPGLVKKTIVSILKALFERNHNEENHSKKVGNLCKFIGESLNLEADEIQDLKIAGIMHDIGKITIDGSILHKKTKLNRQEWNIIKSHAEAGYKILNASDKFSNIAQTVLQHHEKWDGSGYPKGLKGEEILLDARILAVAEAYDALTTYKIYRKQLTKEEAFAEIKRCSGTQFDPNIVKVFIDKFPR